MSLISSSFLELSELPHFDWALCSCFADAAGAILCPKQATTLRIENTAVIVCFNSRLARMQAPWLTVETRKSRDGEEELIVQLRRFHESVRRMECSTTRAPTYFH